MMFCVVFTLISVIIVLVPAAPSKWIDLSYPFIQNETVYWPSPLNTPFYLNFGYRGEFHNTYVFFNTYGGGEHGGTHVDAPNHFIRDGIPLDKIQINQLVGEGVVVDISAKAEKNTNAEIEVSDLEEWERRHGRMPGNPVVFLYSGWGKFYPDRVKFFGTNSTENDTTFNFPGLHPGAAKWLIEKRKIKVYGTDAPSLDKGQGTTSGFPTHKVLLGAGVPGIEMTANLHRLPPRGFEVFVSPMKIKGGTGGPARIYARIAADKAEPNAAATCLSCMLGLVITLAFSIFAC